MAIVFPIDVPLDDISDVQIGEHNTNVAAYSGFTGRGVVQEFEGDYWTAALRFRRLSRTVGQPVMAFASSLRGAKGTFVLPFPGYSSPRGAAATNPASPVVNGANQAGQDVVNVRSGPASITSWLLAGDIIQIGPSSRAHWHRVLQDVDTDGSGNATIDIWPRVRAGTLNNDLVAYQTPLCLFRLDDKFSLDLSPPVLHDVSLACREAI